MKTKLVKVTLNNNKSIYVKVDEKKIDVFGKNICVVVSDDKSSHFAKTTGITLELDSKKIGNDIKSIERIATKTDIEKNKKNLLDEKKAIENAKKISKELDLNMKILTSYFTFDRSQLVFSFTADDRVDFRELAKKLAAIYKTRIELRQIGVRDKAKEIGGIGPCGRFLCCNSFLNDFESVSINMAKNQFISLKPDKINGICGRLLCCLKYEDDQYLEIKKDFPKLNSTVKYNNVEGKVVAINILKNTVVVEKNDKELVTICLDDESN